MPNKRGPDYDRLVRRYREDHSSQYEGGNLAVEKVDTKVKKKAAKPKFKLLSNGLVQNIKTYQITPESLRKALPEVCGNCGWPRSCVANQYCMRGAAPGVDNSAGFLACKSCNDINFCADQGRCREDRAIEGSHYTSVKPCKGCGRSKNACCCPTGYK